MICALKKTAIALGVERKECAAAEQFGLVLIVMVHLAALNMNALSLRKTEVRQREFSSERKLLIY